MIPRTYTTESLWTTTTRNDKFSTAAHTAKPQLAAHLQAKTRTSDLYSILERFWKVRVCRFLNEIFAEQGKFLQEYARIPKKINVERWKFRQKDVHMDFSESL